MSGWVIGRTGQLARALRKARPELIAFGRSEIDLSDSQDQITRRLARLKDEFGKPDAICLAAAYTAVDKAETEPELAAAINAAAPEAIATWCVHERVSLIHISTDYVFDGGSNRPYRTGDTPRPLNVYGRSKRAGEQAVMQSGGSGAVLRTSWVYDGTGPNFLTAMIAQNKAGNPLRVVNDEIGRPTYVGDLAHAVLAAMDAPPKMCKLYHVTNSGAPVSRADFARAILPGTDITGVSSSEYKTAATRPAYSVLDISDFEADFKVSLPEWREGLDCALRDFNADT